MQDFRMVILAPSTLEFVYTTLNIIICVIDYICVAQYYFSTTFVVSPTLNINLTLFVIPCLGIMN